MTKIDSEVLYEWALKRVEELFELVHEDTSETDPLYLELKLLGNLVADYEDEHYSLGEPSLIDVIKLRMYEMGLSQAALAKKIGVSPSRISDFISGKAEPTIQVGRRISKELNIDPAIVLGV